MPMEIADLEAQAEAGLSITPGTQKADVLRVLARNPEMAFTPSEIASRANIPSDNAPTVCRRLTKMGAARTENGHYYLPQDEATATAVLQALGSAHQREVAQKTAAADESVFGEGSEAAASEQLSETDVETELRTMDDELTDI